MSQSSLVQPSDEAAGFSTGDAGRPVVRNIQTSNYENSYSIDTNERHPAYQNIDNDKEIRLLWIRSSVAPFEHNALEHGTSWTPVCRLLSVPRDSEVAYQAISYTWGSPREKYEIICNGHSMFVTKNCFHVLQTLSDSNIQGPFWIDAISINQHDVQERSAQVSRIGEVFRRAQQTIIYLCEQDLGLTAPVIPLPTLCIFPERRYELEEAEGHGWDSSTHIYHNITEDYAILKPEVFYSSPWFTRTWIVQEVMLARQLVVVPEFGTLLIPWEAVQRAYKHWAENCYLTNIPDIVLLKQQTESFLTKKIAGQTSNPGLGIDALNVENDPRVPDLDATGEHSFTLDVSTGMDYSQLFKVLETTRHFQCKDPRDKLFAILPLFVRPLPSLLEPDYSKPIMDVFRDLTWFLLDSNQPEVLSLASLHGVAKEGEIRPSWVVDWSDPSPQALRLERYQQEFEWSAGCWPNHQRIQMSRVSENVLMLRGLVLGCVGATNVADGIGVFIRTVCGPAAFRTRQYSAQHGDKVCVFLGFRTLFLLRPLGEAFKIVDECAIAGFMKGEALVDIDPNYAFDAEPLPGMIDFIIH